MSQTCQRRDQWRRCASMLHSVLRNLKANDVSVTTRWYIPDRVLLYTVRGKFKVRDMRHVRTNTQQALDTYHHQIHVVFDLRDMKLAIPDRKEATDTDMAETRALLARSQLGWVVCVSDNWLMKLAQNMANQRSMRFRTVPTLYELDLVLAEVASDLAPYLGEQV